MQKTVIINAHVISPGVDLRNATIVIEGRKIKGVVANGPKSAKPDRNCTVVDVRGKYVMPGFIDVHTHGALGYDFCDADPKAVFEFAKAKLEEGVTTMLRRRLPFPMRSSRRRRRMPEDTPTLECLTPRSRQSIWKGHSSTSSAVARRILNSSAIRPSPR